MDDLILKRFMAKVEKTETCWIWTGCRLMGQGYGIFRIGKTTERAHRISYRLFKGAIEPGLYVCHSCDNPPCVNPDHLFLGTHLDNMRDKSSKGRCFTGHIDPEIQSEITRRVWASYTPEQRQARIDSVSQALQGKDFTEDHLSNLRAAHAARRRPHKPRKPRPSVLLTRPHANLGRKRTPEQIERLKEARRLSWASDAYAKRKPREPLPRDEEGKFLHA